MTIEQLQHFFALSQCKNFTLAAKQLYITQPALSKSIAALETELKLQLVSRSTRTVSLTPAGEAFADTCKEILDTARQGLNRARSSQDTMSGRVIFGLPSEFFHHTAVRLLQKLKEVYPEIRADLKFYPANGLLRALDNNNVDFIFAGDWPRSKNLKWHLLEKCRNCIVLPKNHPLASRTSLSFSELKEEAFIIIHYMVSGKEFDTISELSRAAKRSPHVIYEAHSIPELLMQVACGHGITVLAEKYKEIAGSSVVFIPLKTPSFSETNIIWKDSDNPCIRAVSELAVQFCCKKNAQRQFR